MVMLPDFRQGAHKGRFLIVTVIVMFMDYIVCVAAGKLFLSVKARLRVLVDRHRAVQHHVPPGHCLPLLDHKIKGAHCYNQRKAHYHWDPPADPPPLSQHFCRLLVKYRVCHALHPFVLSIQGT